MTMDTNGQQMNAAATGGPLALDIDQLFRTHHRHLLRFVQRYMRNAEDAEDIVQQTFIEALRCAHRYSGLSRPSTWLFGIALNLARHQVRRNCAQAHDALDDVALEQIVDTQGDPAMQLEWRQTAAMVDGMLAALPAGIRATFEAVIDGGSTYEQAACELQIPVGTVRSRVSRVRAAVRAGCGR
jgi:RNA polymerase sigma-70 factor (ECF subfamily)